MVGASPTGSNGCQVIVLPQAGCATGGEPQLAATVAKRNSPLVKPDYNGYRSTILSSSRCWTCKQVKGTAPQANGCSDSGNHETCSNQHHSCSRFSIRMLGAEKGKGMTGVNHSSMGQLTRVSHSTTKLLEPVIFRFLNQASKSRSVDLDRKSECCSTWLAMVFASSGQSKMLQPRGNRSSLAETVTTGPGANWQQRSQCSLVTLSTLW